MANTQQRNKMKIEQKQRHVDAKRSSQHRLEEYVLTFHRRLAVGEVNNSSLVFHVIKGDYIVYLDGNKFTVNVSDDDITVIRVS